MEHICANCGCVIENENEMITMENGDTFCSKGCAESANYVHCEDCGTWTRSWNAYFIENYGYVCDSCYYDGNYSRCDDCGDYYRDEDMRHDDFNMHICDYCYNANWYTCDQCGRLVHTDNTHEYRGDIYCEECYDEIASDELHDYSYNPEPDFHALSEDWDMPGRPLYMGVELEVDRGDDAEELARILQQNESDIYCKSDGSLDDGVEIVSHPCTLAYHTQVLNWKYICDTCLARDFTSHDAETCGLHVHVNRNFFGTGTNEVDLNIAKVVLLVNRFWESHLIPFSRRTDSQLERWAKKNEMELEDSDNELILAFKARELRRKGRYYAVNLTNTNTIEFRFFRGTLKLSTFYATLQFVDTLCRFAKKITINDINTVTWEDIFRDVNYPELIKYLKSRTNFHRDEQEAA